MRQRFHVTAFLPDDLRAAIARRLCEIGGVALIVAAGALAAALGSWSVQDPSLSHATSAHVRNVLGVPGAIAADLLMQLRPLDTGAAKDVSGILRVTRGPVMEGDEGGREDGAEWREMEVLYHVRGDGSVRVWERGEGVG